MRFSTIKFLFVSSFGFAAGLNNARKSSSSITRKNFLKSSVSGMIGVGYVFPSQSNAAVLQSKGCAMGEGDGCSDLAENEFIRKLQERSAAKKDQYVKEALDAYNMKNYPDFFQTVGKVLVKTSDGSFKTFSDEEFAKLKADGKVTLEIPKAMGGKVTDLTQKPILVLKE